MLKLTFKKLKYQYKRQFSFTINTDCIRINFVSALQILILTFQSQ